MNIEYFKTVVSSIHKGSGIEIPANTIKSMEITRKLNKIGTAKIMVDISLEKKIFQDVENTPKHPIMTEIFIKEANVEEEKRFFYGILENYQLNFRESLLILNYVDPLYLLQKSRLPSFYDGKSLEDIINHQIYQAVGDFTRSIQTDFGQTPPPVLKEYVAAEENILKMIYILAAGHGYSFYYDHYNSYQEKIKFIQEKFNTSKGRNILLDDALFSLQYHSYPLNTIQQITIQSDIDNASEAITIDQYSDNFSTTFKEKIKHLRAANISIDHTYFYSNLEPENLTEMCENHFFHQFLKGDEIIFESDKFYDLGELIKFVNENVDNKIYNRMMGTSYLIKSLTLVNNYNDQFYFKYVGGRP